MISLKRIIPPMVTPFTQSPQQEVDEGSLRDLTNFLIEKGVNGLMPTAGAGEYVYLSLEEWKKINSVVVDEANDRVPVVAGILDPGTRNVIARAKLAKDIGADAILVLTHQYYFPDDQEIYKHFEAIATESEMPIVLYNLTRISGKDVNPDVVSRLMDKGYVVSVKESSRDFSHVSRLIQICGTRATVLKGYVEDFLPALRIGAQGIVTTGSNFFSNVVGAIYDNFHGGDMKKAEEMHYALLPLVELMRRRNDVRISKEALSLMGHPVGSPRRPLTQATESDRAELRVILSSLDLM